MKNFKKLNKASIAALALLGVMLCLFGLQYVNFFDPIEKSLLDQKFRTFERDVPKDRVSLAMIDQKSLDAFAQNHGIYWPWPREVYGTVHNYLMAKQARLIVYDVLFDQPDFDRNGLSGSRSDQYLEQMFGTYQNSVLSAQTVASDSGYQRSNLDRFTYPITMEDSSQLYSVHNVPIPRFLQTAHKVGSVAIPTHNESIIRSVPLFFNLSEDKALPSLGVAAYLGYQNQRDLRLEEFGDQLKLDSLNIPLQPDGKYLINWYKKGGVDEGTFRTYPFYGLFRAGLEFRQTGNPKADSLIELKDKIVFVGASAAGLSDIKSTPMSPIEPFPGVEIHATVTNNLLESDFITPVSATTKNIILILIAGLLIAGIFWSPSKINLSLTAVLMALIIVTGLYLFGAYRVWFPTAEIFLSSLLVVIVGYATKYVTEDAQKRAIRSAFDLYLQKELVEQIIEQPELLKLGGDKKDLTVLFSDLAGFTSISEGTPPEELITFLNEYLSEMTDIVFKNKGTLDKYMGDAIMAFWGAPVPQEDHAYYACKCALEMEDKLEEMQQKWEEEGSPILHVRYGLNSGPMVVGNMGSKDRFSYTVLGDNVNLGARLEPANKDFGTKILISESTRKQVKDRLLTREVALLKAKGKSQLIKIFELICTNDSPKYADWAPFVELFHGGLNHYYNREWDKAEDEFNKALELKNNKDMLCKIYLKNIEVFKKNPPGENWEGSYQQINK